MAEGLSGKLLDNHTVLWLNNYMSNAAATARQLGQQAFAAGLTVPMQDEALVALLSTEVSKLNVKLMKAWSQGWTAANLAAPVR